MVNIPFSIPQCVQDYAFPQPRRHDGRPFYDTEVHKAGPFPWVRQADESLQAGPDGEEIARYRGGIWTAEDHTVPKCIIRGSTCTVRFEADRADDSAAHAPCVKVELVDGSVYAHPVRRLLARLDEQEQKWYSYEDKRSWPKIVVEKSS
jgi:hypothetical protein